VKRLRRIPALLGVALVSLIACAGAQAAVVTVGPTVSPVVSVNIGNPATILHNGLGAVGGNLTSPINGTIIRWRVNGFAGGPFKLRVLTPLGGVAYLGSGSSAPVAPAGPGLETFATNLPIKAGQTIGVDNANEEDKIGIAESLGASYSFYVPPLADGASGNATGPNVANVVFTFSADVLPPPSVAAVTPAKGSIKGGTEVTILGQDFVNVSAVSFGSQPALGYTVVSDTVVKAFAPPAAARGPVPVTVTTPAGSAAGAFTYTACVVPNVAGKKLKGAKKRIRKAGCKVGNVKFVGDSTPKTGRVVKQRPKAGKVFAPGKKVHLKLAG